MDTDRKFNLSRVLSVFSDNFGLSRAMSLAVVCFMGGVVCFAVFWFVHSAPPRRLTITGGPPGSAFERYAQQYRTILARNGVDLKILPSQGSLENLERLEDPSAHVDIGFVQGGVADEGQAQKVVSLGSIAYQPLLVFYRNTNSIRFLSGLEGKRLAIGAVGSGTHSLATLLLRTNGIGPGGTTQWEELDADTAAQALIDGNIDAVFMMSDSASSNTIIKLIRSPGVQLMGFEQADAYARKLNYLNKLLLPEGAINFAKNLPAQDIWLIGPTVELLAKPDLNPAVSDLLLEAAQEVHGKASMFQSRGEFPAMVEHEFKLSADAVRYTKSGKTFMYKHFPFWFASLADRILVAFVPMMLVLIPGIKLIPTMYKWRIQLRIYRWYRALLILERDLTREVTPAKRNEIQTRLDEIEKAVKNLRIPASFAFQFYSLRGHIDYIRAKLAGRAPGQ